MADLLAAADLHVLVRRARIRHSIDVRRVDRVTI
jgi:hypothetical protein